MFSDKSTNEADKYTISQSIITSMRRLSQGREEHVGGPHPYKKIKLRQFVKCFVVRDYSIVYLLTKEKYEKENIFK